MIKNVRCRIYPNKQQKNLINQTFGCCRLVYNKALSMREEAYKAGSPIGFRETAAMIAQLKKQDEFSFLKLVDSQALIQSVRDLDQAYKNVFRNVADILFIKASIIIINRIVRLEILEQIIFAYTRIV